MKGLSLRLKTLLRIKSVFITINIVTPAFFLLDFVWFVSVSPFLWFVSLVNSFLLKFY